MRHSGRMRRPAFLPPGIGLAANLASAGVTHFVRPEFFDQIVPESLPGTARMWTYVSGAAELAVAATLVVPRTRHRGAVLAAVLIASVWPANMKMAFDFRDKPMAQRAFAYVRVPLQLPLFYWCWRVWRATATPDATAVNPRGAGGDPAAAV